MSDDSKNLSLNMRETASKKPVEEFKKTEPEQKKESTENVFNQQKID